MAINKDLVYSTLNDLIETLKDGENGFKTAAESVKESDLKNLFVQYSTQRSDYINELESLVTKIGGNVKESGSVTGAIHRGWIDLKAAVSSNDAQAILNECERGEDVAVKEYSSALKEDLPADVKSVISEQYGGIKAVHDNVKRLRDIHKG